ncbi:MAG: B12-binding domain-containing radical SAM protein [Pseudomonadota bacterium]|nr:B12-binding domain-containing radical SAM protein [Pseudomonadota bacterium]
MQLALVLPPLTQLNAPYPGPAYLARALRDHGIATTQRDLGIEWVLRLYSKAGLAEVFDSLADADDLPEPAWRAIALREAHEAAIGPVIRFLQGKDRTLAPRLLDTPFLPRGPRSAAADLEGFGPLAVDDAARHLATLYLADLADLVTSCVDEGFSLIRYQHHLAVGPASFDALATRLARTTLLDGWLDELADTLEADVVGLSVPFPGNLYGALRIGRRLRARGVHVILGGGYVNTELRDMQEPRLWDYVDTLAYDDGEGPLLAILEHLEGGTDRRHRTRTRAGLIWDAPVVGAGGSPRNAPGGSADVTPATKADIPAAIAAFYGDLRLDHYLQLVDSLNPAHRLWSDGRWNKITLAHGCYWRKCSFCDIQLDYIARYVPARAERLADVMDELVRDTGQSGFHFVDEAAPPRGLRDLALELLQRRSTVTLWGNIRFEAAFTPDVCRLLAAAGLIAVTGGLEVASDRLLARMEKGVTIEQVAIAASAFRQAGVMVHAYLMYGFPTQTEEETVDSLEIVRQLFAADLLSSAFWHRFVLTRHSGIAVDPTRYGVTIPPLSKRLSKHLFAANDMLHVDATGADPDKYDAVLPRALKAWMRGRELDRPAHTWFDTHPGGGSVAPTREPPDRIAKALAAPAPEPGERLLWLGGEVLEDDGALLLHTRDDTTRVKARRDAMAWLAEVLDAATPGRPPLRWTDARAAFPGDWERFAPAFAKVRRAGLVGV